MAYALAPVHEASASTKFPLLDAGPLGLIFPDQWGQDIQGHQHVRQKDLSASSIVAN